MLLINFFKKASVIHFAIKGKWFLMLFLGFKKDRLSVLTILLFIIPYLGITQNLDNLFHETQQLKDDSTKIRMYNKIGFSYIFNDTERALEIIEEGKQLAQTANFTFGLTELTNTHGIYFDVIGKSDSASFYFRKALDMSREFGYKSIESMCINNLGMFNWNNGNYDEALDYFFESLKINERYNNEQSKTSSLNNIGLIYQEMNLNEKALEYHKKALEIRLKYNKYNEQIASYNNIGINLKDLGRLDEAIEYFNKGIVLAKEKNNLIDLYRLLDNLGNAYNEKGDIELALATYLKALDRPEDYKADEKGMLATYNNIATLYNEKNDPKRALKYIRSAFKLLEKFPEAELIAADLYLANAESHYMLNDYTTARKSKAKYIKLKDSIFSEKNAKAIADLEVKYETEKKEKEILIQRAELAEQDLVIQKRNYQLLGLAALGVVLGLIGFLFYNQQKLKNQQLLKENELKDALIKIETQNKLQEQRLRISRDLHDNIGAQLTFIISSIDNLKYGFDIKDEKLTSKLETISEFTSGTIYELRDTIWAMNKSEITFEDLQSRISNFIDKAHVFDSNIKFEFNVASDLNTSKTFSSVEGMNIHRVTQEAIHNSLKYAEASLIKVEVFQEVSNLIFKISDNGKGFNLDEVTRGNGLNNMEKRIESIGGVLKIASNLKGGTEVVITI